MPTSLTFTQHLGALEASGTRLANLATSAGRDRPVPTCPAWHVHALVAAPDVQAMRFLDDAPAPRQFWARRRAVRWS